MCGIAGIFKDSPNNFDELTFNVTKMIDTIHHRGPDGQGVWIDPLKQLALGHVRLAILDLSEEGKQPMVSHSGNYVLVFNGEIYNHIELRNELSKVGVRFHGSSDTEVLLESIDYFGFEKTLDRIRGMFAFSLWDVNKRCLFLARDRIGKKPLYIYKDSNKFLFSSEIKGILAAPNVNVEISQQALSNYLSLGFSTGTETIYKEITEVQPGTYVCISNDLIISEKKTYWQFPTEASNVLPRNEIIEKTEQKLKESVNIRLRSDVPVGVFLSGGIDSGLITAFAAEQSSIPLQSFTVSFGNSVFDESALARQVAQRYGTEHNEICLEPNIEELLPKIVRAFDEPIADPSVFPTYAISAEAAKHVKVVLNGEGSDELFGGYRRIYAMRLLQKIQFFLKRIPKSLLDKILNYLPQSTSQRSLYSFSLRFLKAALSDTHIRYLLWTSDSFTQEEKLRLGISNNNGVFQTDQTLRNNMSKYSNLPQLPEFMAMDFLVGMTDCLLPKIDIATMAHGLEGRSPFLDHQLVEWVGGIDKNILLSGKDTKPILRDIARKYLPQDIVSAPKRGFEIPLVRWMTKDLNAMVYDLCTAQDSILFELFEPKEVLSIMERKIPLDDERWSKLVWPLFMLSAWGKYVKQ